MFNVKMDLFDFDKLVGLWSGAKTRWDKYTDEQKNYLNECASEMDFESLTSVNDFIWFDADDILNEEDE